MKSGVSPIYEDGLQDLMIKNYKEGRIDCNNFLALKISYMNDIANLCELVGADIEDIARGMRYDDRIGANKLGG